MKKKIMIISMTVLLCLTLVLSVAACQENPLTDINGGGSAQKNANLVAFSASSSALILDEMQESSSAIALSGDTAPAEGATLTDAEIQEVKAQLAILENYMGANAPVVSEGAVGSGDKYFGEYEYMMTVTTKDMHGNDNVYTMYFNQTKTGEKTEYDDDESNPSGSVDFEFEEEFAIDGVLVSGDNVYTLEGKKENESETEDGVTETESSYKLTVRKSDREYIVFEQSFEEEAGESEQEYEYKVYSDGRCVKEFSLEFENELNESEVEMTTIEDGKYFTVSYESEIVNGKERIKAEVTKDNKVVEVIITVEGSGTEEDPYRHIYTYGEIEDVDYDD